jgi:tetratricopeptide (TPR) repeat protein
MKAEERKEIETNSLVLLVQKWRKNLTWRTGYYVIGTLALIITGVVLYRYFTGESSKARDAILEQLASANTPQKLKEGMEAHRGTVYGSLFKIQLARYLLKNDGLPKVGTDNETAQQQAANAIADARGYFLELTAELKEKHDAGMVQEAWASAAKGEETLVGLPTVARGSEYRGNVDKAIEYYEKAAAIFPDLDESKRYKARAEMLKSNKEKFVADQKAIYKPFERAPFTPGKFDPFAPPFPGGPKTDIPGGPLFPPTPPADPKPPELPKVEVPPLPPGPEKGPEPRAVEPGKTAEPKAK